jgi:thymidylate kinase
VRKGTLICITGIDGSGKTTLSHYLLKTLHDGPSPPVYVYGRHQPFLILPLMKLGKYLFHNHADRMQDYQNYSLSKQQSIHRHRILSKLYQSVLLFEYYWQVYTKIYFPLVFFKKTIISDRYVFDTVITDLAIDFDYSYEEIRGRIRHMFSFLPVPDIIFLIDTPEEIAFARKSDTPSLQYLRERRSTYAEIAREYGAVILNGSEPLEQIEKEMMRVIQEKQHV